MYMCRYIYIYVYLSIHLSMHLRSHPGSGFGGRGGLPLAPPLGVGPASPCLSARPIKEHILQRDLRRCTS